MSLFKTINTVVIVLVWAIPLYREITNFLAQHPTPIEPEPMQEPEQAEPEQADEKPIEPKATEKNQLSELQHTEPKTTEPEQPKIPTQTSKPKCWRIAGIPRDWTKDYLLKCLRKVHKSLEDTKIFDECLTLYPSCADDTQTALLDLEHSVAYFDSLDTKKEHAELLRSDGKKVFVTIDCTFYDFTPLNVPEDEIVADLVAVTGLAGHAFGSWRNRESRQMWLRDFLPEETNRVRIMSWGYRSNLDGDITNDFQNALDYTKDLLHTLRRIRTSAKGRPIIFVGHSMGCLLIMQALLKAKSDLDYEDILYSTRTLLFFGAPHQGLDITNLKIMLGDTSSTRKDLVLQLDEGSHFLDNQRDDFSRLWKQQEQQPQIVSFYETVKTPTVKKDASGKWVRDGDKVESVKKSSAKLFLPNEQSLPVHADHTEMVKFSSMTNNTYKDVASYVVKEVDAIIKAQEKKEKVIEIALQEKVEKCLKNLNAPLTYCRDRREELLAKRAEGTCSWFFDDKKYKDWKNDDTQLLWISGKPGSGKSVLASVLTTIPEGTIGDTDEKVVSTAYFFCKDTDESLRTDSAILKALLAQILQKNPSVLYQYFQKEIGDQQSEDWTVGMLWRVLERVWRDDKVENTYLIIDALDECEENLSKDFLNRLQTLVNKPKGGNLKLIITSRPETLTTAFRDSMSNIYLDAKFVDKDIEKFLVGQVHELAKEKNCIELEDEIRNKLVRGANGMFLWASLIMDDLNTTTETSPSGIRKQLATLPKDIEGLYLRILKRIPPESQKQARNILQWIMYAARPLTIEELSTAIAIQPKHTSLDGMSSSIQRNLSQSLKKMFRSLLSPIADDGVINLVHQSAKDFLLEGDKPGRELAPDDLRLSLGLSKSEANITLTIGCFSYLCFDEFGKELSDSKDKYHLLAYAARYWPYHIRAIRYEDIENIKNSQPNLNSVFQKVAQSERQIKFAYEVYCSITANPTSGEATREGAFAYTTLLQIAARFGAYQLMPMIFDAGIDTDTQDSKYVTALQAAAFHENAEVLTPLLNMGVDINGKGAPYGTPIRAAAYNDKKNMVWILKDLGADIDADGGEGYNNALQAASEEGNEEMVRLLVQLGANVNALGAKYGTALHTAAYTGNEAVVKLLVDLGADINSSNDSNYGSPLQTAASNGQQDIVRLLVELGSDVNAYDPTHGNALQTAAYSGDATMVQLLIDLKADVNANGDGEGYTALQTAALAGHEPVVQLLVNRGANITVQGRKHGSALQMAAMVGHKAIVQLLLDNDIDVDSQGGKYGFALQAASRNGHKEVAQLLLERGAKVDSEGGHYGFALQAAAFNGEQEVIRLLIEHKADVNAQGGYFGNALQAAAYAGHVDTVRLLVGHGVPVDCQGGKYGLALQAAARKGHVGVVELLLDLRADVNARSGEYGSALQAAKYKGYNDIVQKLRDAGAC